MPPIPKRKALLFLALAIAAMLVLEAGIADLALSRGAPFAWSIPVIRVSSRLGFGSFGESNLLLILFVVALLSIFLSKDGRKKLLLLIVGAAIVTYLLYHYNPKIGEPPTELGLAPTQAFVEEDVQPQELYPAPPAEVFTPNTPDWLITFVGVSVALALAIALVALLWMALHYRLKGSLSFKQSIAEEIQETIDALEAGVDFKDAISRCYAQMSRLVREERGLVREDAMTTREFEQLLLEKGFPAGAVGGLTRLFEQVRYGHVTPGESGIQAALTDLKAIREHCQALKAAEA